MVRQTDDDKLKIFLSHKSKDKSIAQNIKKFLEKYGPNRIEIYLSEGIPFGEDWIDSIHSALKECDWLFLLFTDSVENWDWCLYEAGFFDAEENKKLLCLYRTGLEPPAPLKRKQSVRATLEDWVKLLKEIYYEPIRDGLPPINKNLTEKDLEDISKEIIDTVGPEPAITFYSNYLILHLNNQQVKKALQDALIPGESEIVESDKQSLRMFGLDLKPFGLWTWQDLTKELENADETVWLQSLGILAKDAIDSRDIKPCLPIFSSKYTKSIFRPYISRIDRLPEGSVNISICFIEIPPEDDPKPFGNLGTISILLSLGRRFRWGILKRFDRLIREAIEDVTKENSVEITVKELDLALNSIESKAVHMGLNDRTEVLQAFTEVNDRNKIIKLFDRWQVVRKDLHEGIKKLNLQKIYEALKELGEMNLEFLLVGSARYHQLIKELFELEKRNENESRILETSSNLFNKAD